MRLELCQYYKKCENCTLLLHDEEEQRQQQQQRLSTLFQQENIEFVCSPQPLNYRSRITLRPNSEGVLGYYRAKSHQHIPIPHCSIAHEKLNQVIAALPPLPFPVRQVEFRTDGERVLANIGSSKGRRPTKKMLQEWGSEHLQGIGLDGQKMWGEQYCHITVADVKHELSLGTFFQVNRPINELLVQRILSWVQVHQSTRVLDLFSGAGNIAFAIANTGIPVTTIEQAHSAIRDAKRTVKRTNLPVDIRKGDASKFEAGDAFFDVAILDPPRKGASGVISELSITRPKSIIYVSCNPYALLKDLNEAKKVGYRPKQFVLFEMFPQTQHIETLVELVSS